MFLMKLQSQEKFSFLQLAHFLARIDNVYGHKEEEIISEYCLEMGIENLGNFDIENFDLEKNLNSYKSKESKKIVVLELMILIHIDYKFHEKEKKLIDEIIFNFNLSQDEIEEYSLWGKSIATLYEKGKNFIK